MNVMLLQSLIKFTQLCNNNNEPSLCNSVIQQDFISMLPPSVESSRHHRTIFGHSHLCSVIIIIIITTIFTI